MTEETKATLDARSAPQPARAAALMAALGSVLKAFEPMVSADMGMDVRLMLHVKRGDNQ